MWNGWCVVWMCDNLWITSSIFCLLSTVFLFCYNITCIYFIFSRNLFSSKTFLGSMSYFPHFLCIFCFSDMVAMEKQGGIWTKPLMIEKGLGYWKLDGYCNNTTILLQGFVWNYCAITFNLLVLASVILHYWLAISHLRNYVRVWWPWVNGK